MNDKPSPPVPSQDITTPATPRAAITDKSPPPVLPVFPEGKEPRRRRTPWWKRVLRYLLGSWFGLSGGFDLREGYETHHRQRWWTRGFQFVQTGWTSFVAALADLFVPVFRFFRKNLEVYLRERQLGRLLYGLPAVLALVGACVMAILLVRAAHSDVRPSYRQQAKGARDGREFELARVCYLRLLHEDKPQAADLFGLYQTLRDLKQEEQADSLLTQLLAWEGVGYPKAHLARALQLLSDPNNPAEHVYLAEQHLLQAVKYQPDLLDAHRLLGQLYFRQRRWKEAELHLLRVEPSEPALAGLLMATATAQGDTTSSQKWGKRATEVYRQMLAADPNDVPARLNLAETLIHLKDYPAALTVLREGLTLNPRPEYRQRLGKIYALQVEELAKDKTLADTATRWQLIATGLQADPNNMFLLQQLLKVTHGTDATAEQARAQLQELVAHGQSSAVLHLVLGLDAYTNGKPEQARVYWELAFDLDQNMLGAANNVAWVLAHPDPRDRRESSVLLACGAPALWLFAAASPADLNRALQLSETVLKKAPDNPSFRETRGQILLRMGQWKEAAADLNYALKYPLPNKGPIHTSLATAYEKLGLPDLAEQHRKWATQPAKP